MRRNAKNYLLVVLLARPSADWNRVVHVVAIDEWRVVHDKRSLLRVTTTREGNKIAVQSTEILVMIAIVQKRDVLSCQAVPTLKQNQQTN